MKQTFFLLAPSNPNGDFINLIKQASVVVWVVLGILLLFSVVSWAIIIFKSLEYRRARRNGFAFIDAFKRNRNFAELNKMNSLFVNNPLGTIFRYGYREINAQTVASRGGGTIDSDSVHRALLRASNLEISRLERLNGFLATTAAATPFIGLFGTVWGIMSSFQDIGLQQNTSLATVAPGIAEALVTTALGLFAAIPAVIFYNFLLNKLKFIIALMEDFTLDFLNASQRMQQ